MIKEFVIKGFIWNSSNFGCECDESCNIGEYLEYENCKCRKKLIDKLVVECTETNDEVKMAKRSLAEHESEYKFSCTSYVALFSIIFTINTRIGTYFVYYKYQKQPPSGAPRKRCSENMQQIYRRTSMTKYDFNKVVMQLY